MSPYWGLLAGGLATAAWTLGVYLLIQVFRTKPRMKEVKVADVFPKEEPDA